MASTGEQATGGTGEELSAGAVLRVREAGEVLHSRSATRRGPGNFVLPETRQRLD
ncbi:hypothetical protein [Streptomyces sp. MMBL 11-3]|uniref:hypothetical protein n=1 Tax=Streptomyces sp. MMBL 11-3 TaxID=3382639 RepID=UPI0039B60499